MIYIFSNLVYFQKLVKNYNIIFIYKFLLIFGLVLSFIFVLYIFQFYHIYYNNQQHFYVYFKQLEFFDNVTDLFLDNSINIKVTSKILNFFSLSIDYFGVIFLLLAYIIAFLSFLALDTRFFYKNWYYFAICNVLIIIVNLFVVSNDLVIFFFLYEALLIPSFLFVYKISQSQRGVQASLYFVIWTQLGSFMVMFVVLYLVYSSGFTSYNFTNLYTFSKMETIIIYFFIFIGFGIKIPIYPFHYWLTKTHVEAPTGFSIFLSGFLVKSALFGFYKFNNLLSFQLNTYLAVLVCFVGSLDASFKMWHQVDLKKLVAYGTIQEMNLIFIPFCFGDSFFLFGGVLFCLTHGFLSAYFFFLVDCIQRRCNSRSISEVCGLFSLAPNLGFITFLGVLLYSGLPGTLKFISEVYIFIGLLNTTPLTLVILVFGVNFLGILGFSKLWFNVIFGFSPKLQKLNLSDLSLKEFFFFFICVLFLGFFQISINF